MPLLFSVTPTPPVVYSSFFTFLFLRAVHFAGVHRCQLSRIIIHSERMWFPFQITKYGARAHIAYSTLPSAARYFLSCLNFARARPRSLDWSRILCFDPETCSANSVLVFHSDVRHMEGMIVSFRMMLIRCAIVVALSLIGSIILDIVD